MPGGGSKRVSGKECELGWLKMLGFGDLWPFTWSCLWWDERVSWPRLVSPSLRSVTFGRSINPGGQLFSVAIGMFNIFSLQDLCLYCT